MGIAFNNISAAWRVPLFYVEVDNSAAQQRTGDKRTLLVGQRLSTGTVAAGVLTPVSSASLAATYFGRGSQLHAMAVAYFANDPLGEVWAVALADDGAAVAATGSVAVSGTATEDGTISLYIAGDRRQIPVLTGDNAAAVIAAILADLTEGPGYDDLPVVPSGSGPVVLTARNAGASGNDIQVAINVGGPAAGEKTPAGLTVTPTSLSGGATNPAVSTAITAMAAQRFFAIVQPYTDSTNLNLWRDEMEDPTGRWSPVEQLYGHCFTALRGTQGALTTAGNLRNDPHHTIFGFNGSNSPSWKWAAACAGRAAAWFRNDPARPVFGLTVNGILPPPEANQFTATERNTLLFDGISTTSVVGGKVALEQAITTYQLNSAGEPDASYLKVQTMYTNEELLGRLKSVFTGTYPRHKLANDGTKFGPGQAIATPSMLKGEFMAVYMEAERDGLVENADAFKDALLVQRNEDDPNRVDAVFPPDLINQLDNLSVLFQFRLQYQSQAA